MWMVRGWEWCEMDETVLLLQLEDRGIVTR